MKSQPKFQTNFKSIVLQFNSKSNTKLIEQKIKQVNWALIKLKEYQFDMKNSIEYLQDWWSQENESELHQDFE